MRLDTGPLVAFHRPLDLAPSVIVQTQGTSRGNWNVGRVVSVYPGQDDKVRNVKGEYERAITNIVVINRVEGYRDRFLVSKETVVLRRWERLKQKFGFITANELIKVELPP